MPDRIVRTGILTSDPINALTWGAEVFYRRLMSVVDDYGRFDGRLVVLRAAVYPLKLDKVSDADVGKWLTECVSAGLVSRYSVESKEYICILKFNQRIQGKPKWPPPDGSPPDSTVNHGDSPLYSETETETRIEDVNGAQARVRVREELHDIIERIRDAYPRKGEQQDCRHAIRTAIDAKHQTPQQILADVQECAKCVKEAEQKGTCSFVPSAGSFFSKRQWTDPKKFEGIAINVKAATNGTNQNHPRASGDLNKPGRYA